MPMINYAHRGASEYYPENTLRSFYAGLDMEANGIETDIQRTKDGILVLHHDDTLARIPHVAGSIQDYTYDELLKMDFGAFKGERFAGERIVKLDTFLTHFAHRDLTLALEIKQRGIEADCLRAIHDHRCRDEVIFTSFIWDSVTTLRELDADIMLGYLTGSITEEVLDHLAKHGIQQICPRVDLVTDESMALAQSRGFSVRFWGAKTIELMNRALDLGGDGMTCNFPDKLHAAIQKRKRSVEE